MPPDFSFPDSATDFWMPARYEAEFRANRDQYFLYAVARLKPETTLDQAGAQLATVMDADPPRPPAGDRDGDAPAWCR